MYHHIANLPSDVWDIAVSPENFEQQLSSLKQRGNVISLDDMVALLKDDALTQDLIAITFDDGYLDNLSTAVPLLTKYDLPATFFITSKQEGNGHFWWDELEHLFLFTEKLPAFFKMNIADNIIDIDLQHEVQISKTLITAHAKWNACEESPLTKRAALFYQVWEKIKPLSASQQQTYLQQIRAWAGTTMPLGSAYSIMSSEQITSLSKDSLFTIGAHTETHIALGFQDYETQKKEIAHNQVYLNNVTANNINLLAYPYGNYNAVTQKIAAECSFNAAFTTEEGPVLTVAEPFKLGRFKVENVNGKTFNKKVNQWLTM